ncbi:MAG: triose-phosphate isomerase, partial [Deltaproteobacteria bacterium]
MFERRPLIAGNWKMNLSIKESIALIQGIAEGISDLEGVDVLVAPPFTSLAAVRQAIGEAKIFLAGQNMYHEMSGPYTGEVSGRMLQEAGCTHVIVGHSERRSLFHETDQDIDLKL